MAPLFRIKVTTSTINLCEDWAPSLTLKYPHEIMNKYDQKQQLNKYTS